ncbi:MAG: regulatory protein RecX [Bacteroidales bacterium]|nr:regulatory protein RecX [Bacteroidales bacterium]
MLYLQIINKEFVKSRIITPLIAIEKAKKYCAYQERAHSEVRKKLHEWGINEENVEGIISKLITERFINEERFAIAFARGKFRIKKWGKNKIKAELKKRKITEYCLNKALSEIDRKEYIKTLKEIILKKEKEIKEKSEIKRKRKLSQYAISRGFESELVWEVINENL